MKFLITPISVLSLIFGSLSVFASNPKTEKPEQLVKPDVPDQIEVPQSNLVYFTTDYGNVILQLTDIQSPLATKKFKSLIKEGFYDGLDFYRVIEGFVAQAGDGGNNDKPKETAFRAPVIAEFTAKDTENLEFHSIQKPAFLAPETGFINGFPAGRDSELKEHWLLHCPGTVALARRTDPNSASTEFYIVLGHAPRHLDRNMSIIGRVVQGMEVLQRMPRGDNAKGGVIEDPNKRGKIHSAKLGDQLVKSKQIPFFVDNTVGKTFQARLASARHLDNPFFVYPGSGNLDVCYYKPRISKQKRIEKPAE